MSGASPTPLTLSALALLAERPMHPYEMYQLARARHDHRLVNIKPGTLYHAVSRLAAAGYVTPQATEREGNRPERTTYAITDAGRQLLQRSIADLLGTVAMEFPVFPFALGEAHNLHRHEVVALLTARQDVLSDLLAEIEAGIHTVQAKSLPWAYWLQLEYLHHQYSAEAEWLRGAVTDIEAGRFAVPADHQHEDSEHA